MSVVPTTGAGTVLCGRSERTLVLASTVRYVTHEHVPQPLAELVFAWPWTQRAWEQLRADDRAQYCGWVAAAASPAAAARRARVSYQRTMDGRGWAGPLRRTLDHWLAVPRGTTAADARQADAGDGWAGWHPW